MAKAHTLIDNFNDNTLDTAKWTPFGDVGPLAERVREVNGHLEIWPASGISVPTSYGYRASTAYDLTASQIAVELVRPLSVNVTAVNSYLSARTVNSSSSTNNSTVFLGVTRGFLYGGIAVNGTPTYVVRRPYDTVRHRWLRIREEAGILFWEVSADGVVYEVEGSRATQFAVTAVYPEMLAGLAPYTSSPGVAIFDNFNVAETSRSRRTDERRLSARDIRVEAAAIAAERRHPEHFNNNDEVNYPTTPLAGNFSKSLKHDANGDVDPASYASLLRALQSRDPRDFEEIQLASSTALKLTNPQGGLAFDTEGPDAQEMTEPPAPRFDSEQTAHEMGELYWMAVARDISFIDYDLSLVITGPVLSSMNEEFPRFGGTLPVTVGNVFRGVFAGEQTGPYVSQFLIKGNVDQRKPAGHGRDATDGFISYGAQCIDQRITTAVPGKDYLLDFPWWLAVQNGVDKRGLDQFDTTRRFIRNLRDGATYVHFDQVINAFYNAAWILMSEPTGNQLSFIANTTGRPQVDLEFPKNLGNPYDPPLMANDSKTQVGFGTFGQIHVLQVLDEVLGRAIRSVWWQKWGVHRRLRPEEYGGRVDNQLQGRRQYPLHPSIINALQSGILGGYFGDEGDQFPTSYLLPQAFPEGAPTHPAYGAGHATGSGALATMLKAFFNDLAPIENPLQADSEGLTLVPYTGPDAGAMTVGGELNKLAGNISQFRNAAGVHWRSDYTESVLLGEKIAIALLQEMSITFNEDDAFFELSRFDGIRIRIRDGVVQTVDMPV